MIKKYKRILGLFLGIFILSNLIINTNINIKTVQAAEEYIYRPFINTASILDTYIENGTVYTKEGSPTQKEKTVLMEVEIFRPGMAIYGGIWQPWANKIYVEPTPHNGWYNSFTLYVNPMKGDGSDFFNSIFIPTEVKVSGDSTIEGTNYSVLDVINPSTLRLRTGPTFTSDGTILLADGQQLIAEYQNGNKKGNGISENYWNSLKSITSKSAIPSDKFVKNFNITRDPLAVTDDRATRTTSAPSYFSTSMPMNTGAASWSPSSEPNIDNWVVTGVYGDEWFTWNFNVKVPYYLQKYKASGGGGGGTIPPPTGEGKIYFIPPSTPWTNTGKATGFPVSVSASGQEIVHTWVQNYTLTQTTTTWSEKGGSNTTSSSATLSSPFEVKYTMSNITISGGATPTTLPNTGGTILVPEGGYRNLSANATYTQQKGTPIPPTVPPSVNSGDAKNGSSTSYSLSTGALTQVPPPTNPTGSAGTYNIDFTDPILTLGAATNQWSRNILNVPINSYDPPGQYVASGQSGIQSSNYSVSDSSHYGRSSSSSFYGSSSITLNDGIYSIALNNRDVAGNTNAVSDRTYYVDTTLPDCDFSVKVNQGINNGTQRVFWGNGVTRTGDKLYGTLTTHDNLSGLTNISYAWTFGISDAGASYNNIYNRAVTYYDRDSERPSFNIEKPVGDNMYLHVRMTDSAGNSAYYRFGAYEDPIKLRDFRVTDVRDPAWDKVFWSDDKLTQHTGVTYNVSKLPIDDKNNTVYRNAYAKKGYAFYFDLTSEYLYRAADTIEIYPTFYYWDGVTRVPVDLYYNIDNNPFIKVGSTQDTHTFNMKVSGSSVPIGGLRKLTLNDRVRLHKGQAFSSWKGTIQYTNGKEQWWYGKYYIPATAIFTRQGISPRPENLLKKNYIIVNFNIVAYKNGVETNSFVLDNQKFFYNISNPVFPTISSQWASEGGSKSPYLIGDTMIYDNSRSVLDDFDTIITQ